MTPFEAGKQARRDGKTADANPHIIGRTKLGAAKLSEDGIAWASGYSSIGRTASDAEVRAARSVDVSRFRKRPR